MGEKLMVRTISGIIVSFCLLLGLSVFEVLYVQRVFQNFDEQIRYLFKKSEDNVATYEDGNTVRIYWREKKKSLYLFIPHEKLENVDYQLNEALGYLYEGKFEDALPKLEVIMELCIRIPREFSFKIENVF